MNTSKTIVLTICATITLAISLMVIQLLLRKVKKNAEIDGKLKLCYSVWFITLFVAITINAVKTIGLLSEALDNTYKSNSKSLAFEITKTSSLFIGLSIAWFLVWYFVANFISITIIGKRKVVHEIESDNTSYFLIKGTIVIGFIICLAPVCETILRVFMPSIQLPFYH
jgi:hypothetical protein